MTTQAPRTLVTRVAISALEAMLPMGLTLFSGPPTKLVGWEAVAQTILEEVTGSKAAPG